MDEVSTSVQEKKIDSPFGMAQGAQGEIEKSSDNQESSVYRRTSDLNVGVDEAVLHGNVERQVHVSNIIDGGDGGLLNSNNNGGPAIMNPVELLSRPNGSSAKDGPTPGVNLGKRNRNVFSPPSIGSTQGPSQRIFCQSQDQFNEPLDLNTPVSDKYGDEGGEPSTGVQQRESQGVRFHTDNVINGRGGC
ncbi:hypothetical protein Hanom_Chr10g00885881 [Helianthus anomalus]